METKVLILEDYKKTGTISGEDLEKIREAAAVLASGGLVAFPTETVYGLGGDARRADVSARIYAAKGRPSDNPLIVHISGMEGLAPLAEEIPDSCRKLAGAYWPGPMTLVLKKSGLIPEETTGGLDTVAVRMPSDPVAAKLIELSGVPVAAPSANRSGRPSTTTAEHCVEDLNGRIDLILDGGPCRIGVESTIVDLTDTEPVLLRPGAVTVEMLTETLGREPVKDKALLRALAEGEKPKAPGMKYRHYAPKAPLVVVRAAEEDPARNLRVYARIAALASEYLAQGLKTEIICTRECADWLEKNGGADRGDGSGGIAAVPLRVLGKTEESAKIAQNLFAVLRDTDGDKTDRLIAEGFGEKDLFLAIMNRLKKAAGWQIEEV